MLNGHKKRITRKYFLTIVKKCNDICNVCHKQNNKIDKSIQFQNCSSPAQRKCTMLKLLEIYEIVRTKVFRYWECVTCMNEKIYLNSLDNRKIVKESFNSDCKYKVALNRSLGQEEFISKYQFGDTKSENRYSSITDESDNVIDNDSLQPNFKYYQGHNFHKLSKALTDSKSFNLLHTNICSMQGNFKNLQNVINNLDPSFSVISVSEALTPK